MIGTRMTHAFPGGGRDECDESDHRLFM